MKQTRREEDEKVLTALITRGYLGKPKKAEEDPNKPKVVWETLTQKKGTAK